MQQEQMLFSLPLNRLEPIFKKWVSDVIEEHSFEKLGGNSHASDSEPLDVKRAATFLGISQQTIYQNIGKIPHSKRFGKLYFLRSELEAYLADGKVK